MSAADIRVTSAAKVLAQLRARKYGQGSHQASRRETVSLQVR